MPRFLKIYSVVATKGGVGKTTITANIGGIIADMGQRVLLVDADPQQSLSHFFPIEEKAPHGLSQLYTSASAQGCISKTSIKNLDIIINDDPKGDRGKIQGFLRESMTHFMHLRAALDALKNKYDYIFIDSQGASNVVQESVILASDSLLIPINPELMTTRVVMRETVDLVKTKFNPTLGFPAITGRKAPSVKILINKYDVRTTSSKVLTTELRQFFNTEFDDLVQVLDTVLPNLEVYQKCVACQLPVHRIEQRRSNRGKSASEAAYVTMMKLVTGDLEPKLSGLEPQWDGKVDYKSTATAAR